MGACVKLHQVATCPITVYLPQILGPLRKSYHDICATFLRPDEGAPGEALLLEEISG